MANYKNTRGRSYPQQRRSSSEQQRRSSSGDILKTLGAVLVVFLAIGLIGSLFSRSSDSADADKKDPTTATDDTADPDGLITFWICDDQYQCVEGMDWEDFVYSEYNVENTVSIDGTDSVLFHDVMSVCPNCDPSSNLTCGEEIFADTKYYCEDCLP